LSSIESQPIPLEKVLWWKDFHHQLETTQDGSPTLRSRSGQGESMHHSGGAFSETEQIYGSIAMEAFQGLKSVGVLSVGLGLGYNELMISALSLCFPKVEVKIRSFETESYLRSFFLNFINGKLPEGEILQTYWKIAQLWAQKFQQKPEELIQRVLQLQKQGRFEVGQDYSLETKTEKMNIILYDAYSSKTSQELWGEDFLKKAIQDWSSEDCILGTYACTGALKRALVHNRFAFYKKEGFFGKRNSTQGRRGQFIV